MINSNSGRHARKVTLDAAVSNAIAKAVDARKVAAFTVGAAGVLAGAAFAFSATPAMAADNGVSDKTGIEATSVAGDGAGVDGAESGADAGDTDDTDAGAADTDANGGAEGYASSLNKVDSDYAELDENNNSKNSDNSENNSENDDDSNKNFALATFMSADGDAVDNMDRAATPETAPKVNSTIELSKETKDTLPNMYAWGSSDNVYIENGQDTSVTFKFAAPTDGSTITNVAIFPSDGNTVDNKKSRKYLEYYSDPKAKDEHQQFSGIYDFHVNNDGTATLTMSKLYRDGNLKSGESYSANRCIYLYGTDKNGKTVVLYKTNIVRAATLIPPKTAGSIVLKYNQELTAQQIQDKLKAALDAPTEATGKKSIRDQITAASTQKGVGGRTGANGAFVQTPDTAENKVIINDWRAYLPTELTRINRVTSQADQPTAYVTGAQALKTYLVSDLGYKSDPLALTVARYDTRIQKPIVDEVDIKQLTEDQKTEIIRKLAQLNHVPQNKVTFNDKGDAVINFDGVDENDAPKIALRDLVIKKIAEKDVTVPSNDKAVFVANPLDYSKDEIARIKKAIFDANKDNKELGLTESDYENQISLSYLTGNFTAAGQANQGISNGQAENKITVKIKTDKAVAEFTSNVKESKLTKLPDIRKDYDVSWTKTKIDGRDTDEGISWSNDKKTTIIYRYDPTKAEEFDTTKILGLLKATPKDNKSGLRELTGGEQLSYEGTGPNAQKSHMHYALQNGEPTGELTLGNMSGAYWSGNQKVSNSDVNLGDNLSIAGSYSWDPEAGSVTVAGKKDKIFKARLFVEPYGMTYYKDVYLEQGRNPGNTAKAINVIFVPQTNHKTSDLKKSVDEHKTVAVEGKDVPTQSKYYNASDKKKEAYDKALKTAKELLDSVKDKQEKDLTEQQKAQIDNATINLNKARAELDGADTNKDKLNASIEANGKAAEGTNPASGTQATNQFKNVSDPDFKKADGSTDTDRNNAAKEAKKAYDDALAEANKVKEDKNATQKDVDAAKAKLDAAREKLNEFSTNKDELSAAIAKDGKVNTGEAGKTGDEKLKTADPTYQNSTKEERDAYDKAVAEAQKVVADPNASQKEVNEAIKKLKDAKSKLDAKATDKSKLAAAEKQSFDNPSTDASKQSTFYKNALNKKDNGASEQEKQAAEQAIKNYDQALANARTILNNEKATQAQVDEAKKKLEEAEKALHENYKSDDNDLTKAIANNVSGYLMPAYFNAFDQAQKDGADSQAAKDFKAYNDAYQKAKELSKKLKETEESKKPKQTEIDAAKTALEDARKVIDKYATDTSKISAALLHSLAIKASPAYQNASATDATEDAKKAAKAYDDALKELQKAFNDQMDKDKDDDGNEISESVIPDKNIDMTNKDALKKLQAHAKGQPLNRDVTKLLAKLNEAVKGLDKFATKTDELIKSINEDATTHPSPAFKNASQQSFQKPDGSGPDDAKNTAAKKAVDEYGEALNKAKDLLKDPNATQAQINEAKKNLDDKRKALKDYDTNVDKLKSSVDKNGKEKHGDTAATEGTVTSDAYRNASDPHFMKKDGDKLVPDKDKNNQAAEAKKAYDEALTKAQELLKKHGDANTPQDAKPTQKEIDAALTTLNEKRKALDAYATKTDALKTEADLSKADTEGASIDGKFENSPEFKNADAKKGKDNKDNDDVDAYKKALKAARDLLAKKDATNLSERPTQQQVDEALDALKKAKQTIADGYKTNATALQDEAALGADDGNFTKSPEYKNAVAKKDTDGGDNAELKAYKDALAEVKTMLNKFGKDGKPNASATDIPTQDKVDSALDKLSNARKAVEEKYKTNVTPLSNEVGDKDAQGKPVTPPFEASVAYKNALEKANAGDNDATAKLKAYADKLAEAQKLIDQVNNPDQNAKPEDRPTQKQVDDALDALKKAKQAIDDNFKTNAKDLKDEAAKSTADTTDPSAQPTAGSFESTTEYQNALAKKTDGGKDNADVTAYKDALEKARTLLNKFDENGKPKSDAKDVPTQKEVDEALKNLKEIKDKITKNYVTSPHDLQEEFDKSKDGDDDNRDGLFENTPAFKNATAKGDEAAKEALDDYNKKLKAAKDLLDKFDRTTGKPKAGATGVPTQKQLDDALKALQDAKKKIEDDYSTSKSELRIEHSEYSSFENSPEFINAIAYMKDDISGYSAKSAIGDYKKALEDAKKVLDDPNATQDQVDEALRKLKEAKDAITRKYGTDKDKLKDEHDADSDFADSPEFQNADGTPEADAYKKALDEAKKVLNDPNATQAQVDVALKKLREAKDALVNKYKTDKDALQSEADDDPNFRNNTEYLIAGSPEFDAYKKALEDAKKVLSDPNATQAQVDAALKKLRDAKQRIIDKLKDLGIDINFGNGNGFGNGLNGYVPNAAGREGNGYVNNANANAVDKSGLQAEVNNALDVRGNSDAAQAYKNALADAKRVLADANASQADVDAALQRLRDAKAGLLNESNIADHNLAKTGASTGLFAGLAAIFAGFGVAGVASRRRKHSND
ncbi:peptidase [Gardnerella vaginalis]|uniref:peptidase n=1 Tax=Gardnerella vaginalis TaxID=2702 RepID=UPI0039EFCD36